MVEKNELYELKKKIKELEEKLAISEKSKQIQRELIQELFVNIKKNVIRPSQGEKEYDS
jgi:hypothetical protein